MIKFEALAVEKLLILYALCFFTIGGSVLYWEMTQDIDPEEAISFFRHQSHINKNENAAFALSGIRAPRNVSDSIQWAIDRYQYYSSVSQTKYMEIQIAHTVDLMAGESPDPIPYLQFSKVYEPEEGLHYICWLPGADNTLDGCVTEEEMDFVLKENRLMLSRYSNALSHREIDLNTGPSLHPFLISLTKLYAIELWKRNNSYTQGDLIDIAKFLWFWKSISDEQILESTEFSIALINYGIALELFYQTVKSYPEILGIYTNKFSKFNISPINQTLFDRVSIGNFYSVLPEICISRDLKYEKSESCAHLNRFLFKPGRTIDLMYRTKPDISQCTLPKQKGETDPEISDFHFQVELLMRPGNYLGRIYALSLFQIGSLDCKILKSYRYKNEVIGLFALHTRLKQKKLLPKQISLIYESNKEEFRIPDSKRFYLWDQKSKTIGYKRPDSDNIKTYALQIGTPKANL